MTATDPVTSYWFEFERTPQIIRYCLARGCGVSGYDLQDALMILQAVVFGDEKMPEPLRVHENVSLDQLDQGHVVPNMLPMVWRGVWYPMFGLAPQRFARQE